MNYSELPLDHTLQQALKGLGYSQPTPIQAQAIPHTLAGKDVIGIAQTGTGKTAAFSLPLLHHLQTTYHKPLSKRPRALILAPTRELAGQITTSINEYARNTKLTATAVYGGVGQTPQVRALKKGVDVLIATPGRLLDLQQQGHVQFSEVEVFVLDEADRMLDMGFLPDIKHVVRHLPRKRQTLLFSATMDARTEKLARTIQHSPVTVAVAPQATAAERVEQRILFVDKQQKNSLLVHLLSEEELDKVLVFTKTKHRANNVAKMLSKKGIKAGAIHGNKTQNQRQQALKRFSEGSMRVLVGTDVAARGLDINEVSHVINYEMPVDTESYVHRIGRTGRASAEGVAFSFCSAEEKYLLKDVHDLLGEEIPNQHHEYHSEHARNAPPKKPPSKRGKSRGRRRSRRRR